MLKPTNIPLSLYIHIPWCEKKCPYCDFNSHLARTEINEPAYIDALLYDFEQDLTTFSTSLENRKISTVFIGGGTPSLFSPNSFARLLNGLKSHLATNVEITLEANPGSSEVKKFIGFRNAGVNRLSIGIQSFNQQHLTSLGRVHSAIEASSAAEYAKQAGFDNFNLDLMFGLPSQTMEESIDDVRQAIKLEPSHLSCYQLTIEPNTLFHHSPPVTPDDESLWEMQTAVQSELAAAGFQQYEISAYTQNGQTCQHNLNYWNFGDYLGIGAGAHGKITNPIGRISRTWKIKHPATYLKAVQQRASLTGGIEQIEDHRVAFEFMMNALRLHEGFNIDLFKQRTCLSSNMLDQQLTLHQQQGLVSINDNKIRPTARGREMLDSMLQDYLLEVS